MFVFTDGQISLCWATPFLKGSEGWASGGLPCRNETSRSQLTHAAGAVLFFSRTFEQIHHENVSRADDDRAVPS